MNQKVLLMSILIFSFLNYNSEDYDFVYSKRNICNYFKFISEKPFFIFFIFTNDIIDLFFFFFIFNFFLLFYFYFFFFLFVSLVLLIKSLF